MRIALATLADAGDMARVHALAFRPGWSGSDICELLKSPGVFGLCVDIDATCLGMAIVRAMAGEAEILTIGVDPEARRQGIGQAMVEAIAEFCREGNVQHLFLEVAVDNDAAIGLYSRAGFVAAGRRRNYYDRGPLGRIDALVLRLDIEGAGG